VLITCTGPFDQATHSYPDNLVVYAVPVPARVPLPVAAPVSNPAPSAMPPVVPSVVPEP
jgi:hypothetical protein